MDANTANRVKAIIADDFGVKIEDIRDEANVWKDLADISLEDVELVMDLEDAFAIEIPNKAVENVETVRDLIELVESLINKRHAA